MPLWHSCRRLLLQDVLRLLLSHQVCVPLVHSCLDGCGGGLDLLERPGRGAVLVGRWRLAGRHRLKKQGLLLYHLLRLHSWLRGQDARLRSPLLQDLLRSAKSLAHVEVRVPESLRRFRQDDQLFPLSYGNSKNGSWNPPGQKLVSFWDPTAAGLSSSGWLQDWRLGWVSSDYWEHTEATGNSWHWLGGIRLANQSKRGPKTITATHSLYKL